MNLRKLINQATKDGGISYSITTGECNPKDGFMVSITGAELRTSVLTKEILKSYILLNINKLQEGNYLGLWKDGNEWCIDVSLFVLCRYQAIQLARANQQSAFFDNVHKQAVVIKTD